MRSLRLQNFRSLGDTGRIELRPLTVLVGANNSGKSSFLRFFPLLRQTYEARSASPLLWYGRDVDFGDFAQAVRRGAEPREIEIEFEVEGSQLRSATSLSEFDGKTFMVRHRLSTAHASFVMDFEPSGELRTFAVLEDEQPVRSFHGSLIKSFSTNGSLLPHHDGEHKTTGLPEGVERLATNELLAARGSLEDTTPCVYIGPFRAPPERFYRVQELAVGHMDPHGENLAMFLRSLSPSQIEAFSSFALEHVGFRVRLRAEGMHVAILLEDETGESYNLIDMGYGFSQVLPVIAQCWATASGWHPSERDPLPKLLAVEQPELHLHPHYQAKLADLFVGTIDAVPDSRLLVETHSEALVSRLGELVEAGKLASERVSVLLFEQDATTKVTSVRQSTFAPDGTLTNWPFGFFAP